MLDIPHKITASVTAVIGLAAWMLFVCSFGVKYRM